ncbi:MAG: lytic transglycosylase domain-containing protein [Bacteroidales bacterium]|jgi:membrane-bound lytic murein transglycosylase D|nr:lytic transglycosylase domain-containing protein [Bacteroidales bacterium]
MKGREVRRINVPWNWIVPFSVILIVLSVFSFKKTGFGGTSQLEELEPKDKSLYAIFPVEIPENLTFSEENVPLQFFDVKEALDRELLSNVFFHSQTIRLIKMANRYFPQIEPILKEQGVPDDFKYLAIAESGLANAVSPAGAVGFWQIRKGTGTDYGLEINAQVDERYHLEKSTIVACMYLKESFEKYGNWTLAAASYNVGRRGVDRQVTKQKEDEYYNLLLNEETARYVFRILAYKLIIEDPSSYGFHLSKQDLYNPVPVETIIVDSTVSNFADFAAEHNTSYKLLKMMNPWLRDTMLTNSKGKAYEVRVVLERGRQGDLETGRQGEGEN